MNENEKRQYLLKLGNKIRSLRLQLNISQDELAKKCGYSSRSTINKIELGVNDVPQSKIKLIADALNIRVADLLCFDEDIENNTDTVNQTMNRIKQLRKNLEITQEELAFKLGLQKSAIAKYENGRVENIKRSTIEKMAKIFDVSPTYLMGWDEPTQSTNYLNIQSDKENHIINNYRQMNDEGQNKLIDYSDDLVSSNRYVKNKNNKDEKD